MKSKKKVHKKAPNKIRGFFNKLKLLKDDYYFSAFKLFKYF